MDETPFYIPALDAPARPRRNLKHNDIFAVFDSHGDIGASVGGEDGLFDFDTRYLSHLELLISGSRPLLLHSAVDDANLNYTVDLTNPDIYVDGRIVLPKDTIHISRTIYLSDGALRERMDLKNHGSETVTFSLTLSFASDFADIFEVRGIRRLRRGKAGARVINSGAVALSYLGLDDIERNTQVAFQPSPTQLTESVAAYAFQFRPKERKVVFVSVATHGEGRPAESFFRDLVGVHRAHRSMTRGTATIETQNSVVNEILCRSMADLAMLTSVTQDGPYPYAGIPWYSTTFGRDGIITAIEMLWLDPGIAKGVLTRLARLQARTTDLASDAEPGKILHEMRGGEMAQLKEIPFGLYYGTVDATPLFVMLAGAYGARTGDWEFVKQLWPEIEAALDWIENAQDADGFVVYARATEEGLSNQGWKDSHDAIFHEDGSLARGPIALVEVQGYCYAARLAAAECAKAIGRSDRAVSLLADAANLKLRFDERFWCDDLGFYVIALDGKRSPCRVLSSNAGHALWTGIALPNRAAQVATQLLDSHFFTGWGIRTIAETEARYNPLSYHNGSIWPHDNALIARGLERVGSKAGVVAVFDGLMRAATHLDLRRIPELYCGFRRRPRRGPILYPAACSPQAWAAAAPVSLIQSMLGLEFFPDEKEVRLTRPIVSAMAGSITLRNVKLGPASVDLTVRSRPEGGASVEVLRTQGDIRVSLIA
jgi:glycogen debranching enzyme